MPCQPARCRLGWVFSRSGEKKNSAAGGAPPANGFAIVSRTVYGRLPLGKGVVRFGIWSVAAMYTASDLQHGGLRALMKSAGDRVPINGTRCMSLRSEQGVPSAVSPSVCHHLTLRLTVSWPAGGGRPFCQTGLAR